MAWNDIGFSKYLVKIEVIPKEIEPLDSVSFEYFVPEISGLKIVNYTSKNFNYIPASPQANPKEGDTYYDSQVDKLKIYTGSAYETITSA